MTKDILVDHKVKEVLIPGIGYGRNAQIFIENGMTVTGIEISQTAIDLAHKHFGDKLKIYHGSVTDMPFDDKLYDGILRSSFMTNKASKRNLATPAFWKYPK